MKVLYERKLLLVNQDAQARILQFYDEMPQDLLKDFAKDDFQAARDYDSFFRSFASRHQLDGQTARYVVGLVAVLAKLRAIADDFQRP